MKRFDQISRVLLTGLVAGTCLASLGCAPEFDPPSSLVSLRILAVESTPPYAKPGDTVTLDMLYFDGSPKARGKTGSPRPVKIVWLGGCHNPVGDLYYQCFPQFFESFSKLGAAAGGASGPGNASSGGQSGGIAFPFDLPCNVSLPGAYGCTESTAPNFNTRFSFTVPEDILSSRPPPAENNIPYGLSYVFYMLCAGDVKLVDPQGGGLPLGCFDSKTGTQLTQDDFVLGYTPVYTYEKISNTNPIVGDGMTVDGKKYDVSCAAGESCSEGTRCGSDGLCKPVIGHCTAKSLADCTEYTFKPFIDRTSVEPDEVGSFSDGQSLQESMWVAYYSSDGTMSKQVKLVNDSLKGWNEEHEAGWKPPGGPAGEVRIWGVVHDNRGGVAWSYQDIFVDLATTKLNQPSLPALTLVFGGFAFGILRPTFPS
jgi:hypothetical protein